MFLHIHNMSTEAAKAILPACSLRPATVTLEDSDTHLSSVQRLNVMQIWVAARLHTDAMKNIKNKIMQQQPLDMVWVV